MCPSGYCFPAPTNETADGGLSVSRSLQVNQPEAFRIEAAALVFDHLYWRKREQVALLKEQCQLIVVQRSMHNDPLGDG